MLVNFLKSEDGATAIEYGLIAALIALTLIASFVTFGNSLVALWDTITDRAGSAIDNARL